MAILGDLSRAHAKCSNENENENVLKMHRGMKLKGQWTADEDALLTELVDKYGTTRWSYIARALYGRVGKQCRERWNNHLAPDIKRGAWSVEEEETFIQAHMELGNKWSHIAKRLKGHRKQCKKSLERDQAKKRWHKESISDLRARGTQSGRFFKIAPV